MRSIQSSTRRFAVHVIFVLLGLYFMQRAAPAAQASDVFTDVPVEGKEWMEAWIETFYSAGITSGCANNPLRYCPEREVTRAEIAVFIIRALHYPDLPYTPPAASGTFADVPVEGKEWMELWIEEFYALGITGGCGRDQQNNLLYCPERPVTRAEMAVFILRALEGADYQPPAASYFFADVPVEGKDWMEPWIDELYRREITTGCGLDAQNQPIYCPERAVTRAEMAVFILRALMPDVIPSCGDGILDFTTENCHNCPVDWVAYWGDPIYQSPDEPEEKNPDDAEGSDEVLACFIGPDDISGVASTNGDGDPIVTLTWMQIDPALNPLRLQIQRRTVDDITIPRQFGIWTSVVSDLAPDATTFTDVAPLPSDEAIKYQYRIRYFRELPVSSQNEEWSDYHYTTVAIPQDILVQLDTPDDIPTNPNAYAEACSKITLEWTDNTNDETGWEIRRSINNPTMPASAFEITSDGDTDRGDLTGYQYQNPPNPIAHNNTYYFWVRAVNTAPDPDRFSDWLAFNPVTVDCPPVLEAPTLTILGSSTDDQRDLSWNDITDAVEYFVERSEDGGTTWSALGSTVDPTITLSDPAVMTCVSPASGTYTYRVRAYDGAFYSAWSEPQTYNYTLADSCDVLVQISAPDDVPTLIAAYPTICEQITLEWRDNTNDETGWEIRRSTNNSLFSASTSIATTTDGDTDRGDLTGYQYQNPPNSIAHNNTYYFWVRAVVRDQPGPDRSSDWLAFPGVTVSCPPTPPEAPGIVAEWIATDTNTSTYIVSVRWTDNSTIETGFELYRSTSPNFPAVESDWTLLDTYGPSVPATDTGGSTFETYADIPSCGTWYYRIRALGAYTSTDSTVSITVLCSPVLNLIGCVNNTGSSTSQLSYPKIGWDAIGGAQFYNLFAKVVSSPTWSLILQTPYLDCFGNQNANKCFVNAPYTEGVAYNYQIAACKPVVWEGNYIEVCSLPSDGISGNVPPGDALQCPAP